MRAVRGLVACVAAAAAAGGCATAVDVPSASSGVPIAVRNADFEADLSPGRACPPSWWCAMHSDPTSFGFVLASDARSHGRFLKVTRLKEEPWAMVTQVVPAAGLVGKRVRVSAAVNSEELIGNAGPAVSLLGVGGRVVGHRKALIGRGSGWQRASTEIEVVAGTESVEIGLLVEGGGSVGFDSVDAVALPREAP